MDSILSSQVLTNRIWRELDVVFVLFCCVLFDFKAGYPQREFCMFWSNSAPTPADLWRYTHTHTHTHTRTHTKISRRVQLTVKLPTLMPIWGLLTCLLSLPSCFYWICFAWYRLLELLQWLQNWVAHGGIPVRKGVVLASTCYGCCMDRWFRENFLLLSHIHTSCP